MPADVGDAAALEDASTGPPPSRRSTGCSQRRIGAPSRRSKPTADEKFRRADAVQHVPHFRFGSPVFPAMKARGKGSIVITARSRRARDGDDVAYVIASTRCGPPAPPRARRRGPRSARQLPGARVHRHPAMEDIRPSAHSPRRNVPRPLGSSQETANVAAFLRRRSRQCDRAELAVDGGVLGTRRFADGPQILPRRAAGDSLKSMLRSRRGLATRASTSTCTVRQQSDCSWRSIPEGQSRARPRRHDRTHPGDQRYLETSSPTTTRHPARCDLGCGRAARMRYWNKFVDDHVMNHVSMHAGTHGRRDCAQYRRRHLRAAQTSAARPRKMAPRARASPADLANASDRSTTRSPSREAARETSGWPAMLHLADITFYSHCGMMVERMFPEKDVAANYPRWSNCARHDRVPAVAEALKRDRTHPACAPGARPLGRRESMRA